MIPKITSLTFLGWVIFQGDATLTCSFQAMGLGAIHKSIKDVHKFLPIFDPPPLVRKCLNLLTLSWTSAFPDVYLLWAHIHKCSDHSYSSS